MKIITVILVLLLWTPLSAQIDFVGGQSGIGLTNVAVDGTYASKTSGLNFRGGLTYDHTFNEIFHFGLDLIYEQKGYKDELVYSDNNGNSTLSSIGFFNYNYLSLPVKGGVSTGNTFEAFVNVGMVPSFLLNARIRTPTVNVLGSDNSTIDMTDDVTRFDLGLLLESGVRGHFTDRLLVFTAASFQHGFISISSDNHFSESRVFNYGFLFTLGVKYAISKN